MNFEHPFSPQDAIRIQNELRNLVRIGDDFGAINTIAGIDVGYDINTNQSRGALVLIDTATLQPLAQYTALDPTPFPYIPGLLSFREAPVIIKLLEQLPSPPDLLMIDGQGIAHPRRLGIAAHMGVITGLPAIGVAKSLLCGTYTAPGPLRGAQSPLTHKGEHIGTVLRSRNNVKPLFVSPGHRVSHESAVSITLQCLTKYRLPEPTRLADKLSKIVK